MQISLIGELLFNRFYILFMGAAFLLFIAMIGAIVLTIDNEDSLLKEENTNIEKNKFFSKNLN
jgi:hypothetical protein